MPNIIEVLGLDRHGAVVWASSASHRRERLTVGDLARARGESLLPYDPTRVVLIYRDSKSVIVARHSSILPPDAWQDLVALAALLFSMSQASVFLDRLGSMKDRTGRAFLAMGALRDARKLPTRPRPQRIVRFIRQRPEWTARQLGRFLRLKSTEVESLLTISGFSFDEADGLWKSGGPKATAALDLTNLLLLMIEHPDFQRLDLSWLARTVGASNDASPLHHGAPLEKGVGKGDIGGQLKGRIAGLHLSIDRRRSIEASLLALASILIV